MKQQASRLAEVRIQDLMHRYGSGIRAAIARLEFDPCDREELWLDVFVAAFQHMSKLETLGESQTRAWLHSAASHVSSNNARRSTRTRRLQERLKREAHVSHEAIDNTVAALEHVAAREAMSRSLDPVHRAVILLTAAGYDSAHIGSILSMSPATVRRRLMAGRQQLRERQENYD